MASSELDQNHPPLEIQLMKTHITKIIAIIAVALGTTTLLQAGPPGKGDRFKASNSVEEVSSMKKGDKYVLVCKATNTATVCEVEDDNDASQLCHDGGTIHCESCDKKYVITRSPKGKGGQFKIVNEDGKECMVVIPLKK